MQIHMRPIEQASFFHVHMVDDLHLNVDARAIAQNAEYVESPQFVRELIGREFCIPKLRKH